MDIKTTNGETFTHAESCDMAFFVFRRFGRDASAATAAWNRMLQNNCSEAQFLKLVNASDFYYEDPRQTVKRLQESIKITDKNTRTMMEELHQLRDLKLEQEAKIESLEEQLADEREKIKRHHID